MKAIGERMVLSRTEEGGPKGETVIVGVKLDAKSKELLTWTLMKVASAGDSVIALHVFDSSEFVRGTGNLLCLIQTLDSLLSAYEGFCNLKQVDLKLKLCRGTSARKIIVREAKASSATKVVVGACNAHHSILSWKSVAKYCSRKLPKNVAIYAVRNGKPQFQRETTVTVHSNQERQLCIRHSSKLMKGAPIDQVVENLNTDDGDQDSLDYSILQGYEAASVSCFFINEIPPKGKHAWSLLRHILLPKNRHSKRFNSHPSTLGHSKGKRSAPCLDGYSCATTPNEAIMPIGPSVVWLSTSRHHCDDLHEVLKSLGEKYTSCRIFSYDELLHATSNFLPENLVGQGGSSFVYKGCLSDGKEVAVKILRPFKDVLKEFLVEVDIVTTLHHKNICSLLGFCFENDRLLLIYDFLSRGSLEENLHGKIKDYDIFNWEHRFKVALGVAEALNYLHNGRDQPVIHRDVKSSNILLSDDFEPRLSDFGFSSQVSDLSSTGTCSDLTGTFGYLAPEYFMHGKVSDKVDVFAYGVVLLELLSGRKAISKNMSNQESIVMWAKPVLESGGASDLIDSTVGGICDESKLELMLLAAKLCLKHSAKHRPPISLVLRLLQGDDDIMQCARQQIDLPSDEKTDDDELRSHLSLALQDLDDDSLSMTSNQLVISFEEYLRGRCTRTSSPDATEPMGIQFIT